MAKQDGLFLVAYVGGFITFILFCVAFSSEKWIQYEEGYRGLWIECTKNNDSKTEEKEVECNPTTLAEGPGFLDLSRTFMCFGLVAFIFGAVLSQCFSNDPENDPATCKGAMKVWSQEIGYCCAASFGFFAMLVYGFKYYDYHSTDLRLTRPELYTGFYMACGATGGVVICAFILAATRKAKTREAKKKKLLSPQNMKLPLKPKAKDRNAWLKNNKVPTPVNQTTESVLIVEEDKKEVPVKNGKLARYILPVTLIQAVRRLRKGASSDEEKFDAQAEIPNGNDLNKVTMNTNQNDKYKGIFTIDADNRAGKSPVPVQEVPKVQINKPTDATEDDSTTDTESYTDSDLTSDDEVGVKVDGHVVPTAERVKGRSSPTVGADNNNRKESEKPRTKEQKSLGKPLRPSVRRSVTTLGKGEEPAWTKHTTRQSRQKPPPPRKTLSQIHQSDFSKTSSSNTRPQSDTIPESIVNIYTLPADPGYSRPSSSVSYEEVVVGRGEGKMSKPEPVITYQSSVYQPYS